MGLGNGIVYENSLLQRFYFLSMLGAHQPGSWADVWLLQG